MSRPIVADQFEILTDQPLPDLNVPLAKAYAVQDVKNRTDFPLFALKTTFFPTPRYDDLDKFLLLGKQNSHLKLIHLQAAENVTWPGQNEQKCLTLIYNKPNANTLMATLEDTFSPWSHDQIQHLFLLPFFEILEALYNNDLIHRAIRPTNMFFDDQKKQSPLILGECLSSPYGYDQDFMFEPLSYALADPIGRGKSSIANDLFALATTLVFLLSGGNPCRGKTKSEIIESRLENGSFVTYVPKHLQNSRFTEALKGLLNDTEEQQWTLQELNAWLQGISKGQNISTQNRRAKRPISFNGRNDIYSTVVLAHEMRQNPVAAIDLINKNHLLTWLKNSLNDSHCLHLMDSLKVIIPDNVSKHDYLLGILKVLDSKSPFFWQGRCLTDNGIPLSFAQAIYQNDRLDGMIQFICSPILAYFLMDNRPSSPESGETTDFEKESDMAETIKTAKAFLEYNDVGGGIERCLYYICPHLPCFSPIIKNYNCTTVQEILLALDHLALQPNRPEYPIDQHIIAFIITHEKSLQQRYIFDLNAKKIQRRVISMFKLLSELQRRSKIKKLPGLCQWFADLSEIILKNYKNIKHKNELKDKIDVIIHNGNLSAMVNIIDNKKAIEFDYISHQMVLRELDFLDSSVTNILHSFSAPIHYSEKIGQNNAMIASASIAFLSIISFIISKVIL